MGKRGDGYGSEDHLLRYLAAEGSLVTEAVAREAQLPLSELIWLDPPRRADGRQREFQGIEFLPEEISQTVASGWREFWPQTGRKPSWDAVGRTASSWLLVEAKASHPEFCTPPSGSGKESRKKIEQSLNRLKSALGVHRYFPWTGTYYQYANRLAMLWFLRNHDIDARLVFIYFIGDRFPDATPCPASEKEWDALLEARRLTLGLPSRHSLSGYEHHIFLPALVVEGVSE